MPLGVRRTAFATRRRERRRPDGGRGSPTPETAASCRRAPHSPNAHRIQRRLHLRRDLRRRHLPDRRGRADRLHHQVPPRQAAAHRRGAADPRLDEARGALDGRPGRPPRRDRRLRLLQAARHRRRAEGERRRLDDDPDRGPSVLLALPLSERRDLDRPRWSRPADQVVHEDVDRPRLRRQPLVVGARPRRQVRRDPGQDRTRRGSRRPSAATSRAAPSSAASSTR